jgi:hypothetical protein
MNNPGFSAVFSAQGRGMTCPKCKLLVQDSDRWNERAGTCIECAPEYPPGPASIFATAARVTDMAKEGYESGMDTRRSLGI